MRGEADDQNGDHRPGHAEREAAQRDPDDGRDGSPLVDRDGDAIPHASPPSFAGYIYAARVRPGLAGAPCGVGSGLAVDGVQEEVVGNLRQHERRESDRAPPAPSDRPRALKDDEGRDRQPVPRDGDRARGQHRVDECRQVERNEGDAQVRQQLSPDIGARLTRRSVRSEVLQRPPLPAQALVEEPPDRAREPGADRARPWRHAAIPQVLEGQGQLVVLCQRLDVIDPFADRQLSTGACALHVAQRLTENSVPVPVRTSARPFRRPISRA